MIKLNNSRFGLLTIPPMEKWRWMECESHEVLFITFPFCCFKQAEKKKRSSYARSTDDDHDDLWRQRNVLGKQKIMNTRIQSIFCALTFDEYELKYLIRFDFAIDIPNACHICVMRLNGNSNIFISFHFDLNWISSDATPVQWTLLVEMHSPLLF